MAIYCQVIAVLSHDTLLTPSLAYATIMTMSKNWTCEMNINYNTHVAGRLFVPKNALFRHANFYV